MFADRVLAPGPGHERTCWPRLFAAGCGAGAADLHNAALVGALVGYFDGGASLQQGRSCWWTAACWRSLPGADNASFVRLVYRNAVGEWPSAQTQAALAQYPDAGLSQGRYVPCGGRAAGEPAAHRSGGPAGQRAGIHRLSGRQPSAGCCFFCGAGPGGDAPGRLCQLCRPFLQRPEQAFHQLSAQCVHIGSGVGDGRGGGCLAGVPRGTGAALQSHFAGHSWRWRHGVLCAGAFEDGPGVTGPVVGGAHPSCARLRRSTPWSEPDRERLVRSARPGRPSGRQGGEFGRVQAKVAHGAQDFGCGQGDLAQRFFACSSATGFHGR